MSFYSIIFLLFSLFRDFFFSRRCRCASTTGNNILLFFCLAFEITIDSRNHKMRYFYLSFGVAFHSCSRKSEKHRRKKMNGHFMLHWKMPFVVMMWQFLLRSFLLFLSFVGNRECFMWLSKKENGNVSRHDDDASIKTNHDWIELTEKARWKDFNEEKKRAISSIVVFFSVSICSTPRRRSEQQNTKNAVYFMDRKVFA